MYVYIRILSGNTSLTS